MLLDRMRSPSIYLEEPLRELVAGSIPEITFADLAKPLLVNTVDLDQGARVVWGLPGLQHVPVRDAVYASCALPGFFPPGQVGDRTCIDGGVVDNLPVSMAAHFADIVIAVDVGSSDASQTARAEGQGFATIYMRAATMMMHALQQFPLERWHGPPMVLVRPRAERRQLAELHRHRLEHRAGLQGGDARAGALRLLLGPRRLRLPAPPRADRRGRREVHGLRHLRGARPRRDGAGRDAARPSRVRGSWSGRPPRAASCTSARRSPSRATNVDRRASQAIETDVESHDPTPSGAAGGGGG